MAAGRDEAGRRQESVDVMSISPVRADVKLPPASGSPVFHLGRADAQVGDDLFWRTEASPSCGQKICPTLRRRSAASQRGTKPPPELRTLFAGFRRATVLDGSRLPQVSCVIMCSVRRRGPPEVWG